MTDDTCRVQCASPDHLKKRRRFRWPKPSIRFYKKGWQSSGHVDLGPYDLKYLDVREVFPFGWLLLEKHTPVCLCSHCKDFGSFLGRTAFNNFSRFPKIRFPLSRAVNSWRTIYWKHGENKWYLRWTLPMWFKYLGFFDTKRRKKWIKKQLDKSWEAEFGAELRGDV